MKRFAALVLVISFTLAVRSAGAQPEAKSYWVLGSAGVAAQPLKDWNDDIRADERDLKTVGIPVEFKELGIGIPIHAGAGYMVNDYVSVGGSLGFQRASNKNAYSDATGSLSIDTDIMLLSLLADVTYWLESTPGLAITGAVGVGRGSVKRDESYRGFGNPANDEIHGDWTGFAPIADLSLAYFERLGDGPLFFGRLGFRQQNLGKMDGDFSSQRLGNSNSPPRDNAGAPMETNLSGAYFMAGVGWILGKRY